MENFCEQLQYGSAIIYLIVRERESRRTRCCRVTCRGPIGYRFTKYTRVSIVYCDFFSRELSSILCRDGRTWKQRNLLTNGRRNFLKLSSNAFQTLPARVGISFDILHGKILNITYWYFVQKNIWKILYKYINFPIWTVSVSLENELLELEFRLTNEEYNRRDRTLNRNKLTRYLSVWNSYQI